MARSLVVPPTTAMHPKGCSSCARSFPRRRALVWQPQGLRGDCPLLGEQPLGHLIHVTGVDHLLAQYRLADGVSVSFARRVHCAVQNGKLVLENWRRIESIQERLRGLKTHCVFELL